MTPAEHSANPLARDLDHALGVVDGLWEELRGRTIFVTGGTGFVGRWMLESLTWADDKLELGVNAVVLTRNPQGFSARHPHLAGHRAIQLLGGDMLTCELPSGEFSHVLHMATETNTELASRMPSVEFDTAVEGTRRMLDFAERTEAARMLYTSSGAVYGRQPAHITHVREDEPIAPPAHDARAAYSHGKRAAEFLCAAATAEGRVPVTIARLFAFVGPYLPLDAGYAVGNFIGDALAGRDIQIGGDGTPRRSYLYAADLASWLWTILLRGEPGRPYNVGSADELSILELAETVSRVLAHGALAVDVARLPEPGAAPLRYVPDVSRAADELGLTARISLEEGIKRTAEWHQAQASTQGDAHQ